jgi:hypothetical protein
MAEGNHFRELKKGSTEKENFRKRMYGNGFGKGGTTGAEQEALKKDCH